MSRIKSKKSKKRARHESQIAARSTTVQENQQKPAPQFATMGSASSAGTVPAISVVSPAEQDAEQFIREHFQVTEVPVPGAYSNQATQPPLSDPDGPHGQGHAEDVPPAVQDAIDSFDPETLVDRGSFAQYADQIDDGLLSRREVLRSELEAISLVDLRKRSRRKVSGGYSLKKPALIEALIAAELGSTS